MIKDQYIAKMMGRVKGMIIQNPKEFLDEHNITPYYLMVDSGLVNSTIYRLTNNTTVIMQRSVFGKVLNSLCKLTGKWIGVVDVLEHTPLAGKTRKS